ncbi:MAG TPA: hypothetical protein VHX63_14420 [Acidobacteriaceae bacterium]|nr:hypothetical protein [Acidobacteriaceae bacterium]
MTTVTKLTLESPKEHIQGFERKLHELKQVVADFPGDDYYTLLVQMIHRPGWTTPAETMFFESVVDSMLSHARALSQLHQGLFTASQAVGLER